jgi:hypothetical protein
MVEDSRYLELYLQKVFDKTAEKIYSEQIQKVEKNNIIESGHLLDYLEKKLKDIQVNGSSGALELSYLSYLRFLDRIKNKNIKKRAESKSKNMYQLYNRIVYGVTYNQTYTDLIYGFTEDARKKIKQELEKALC